MNLFKGKNYLIFPVIFGLCSIATTIVFATKQTPPVAAQVKFRNNTIGITTFGSESDRLTLNTIINKAIAKGGGGVLIPLGLCLTRPIELKSHLKRDAIL